MNFLVKYSLPLLAALLLIIFYLGLPDLHSCTLRGEGKRRLDRVDAALMAGISLAYALVAFWNLGNTQSPESFVNMENRSVTVELGQGSADSLMLFSGVGIGEYTIEYAPDGENFQPLTNFHQSHAEVLKWNLVPLDESLSGGSLRISGYGNVWLGAVAGPGGAGEGLSLRCGETALVDEQATCPREQTFMNSSYFDEIYHARTAWEHLNGVYPYEITHPPLGKIILSWGIAKIGKAPSA